MVTNDLLTQSLNQFFQYLQTIENLDNIIEFSIPNEVDFLLEYHETLNIRLHDVTKFGESNKNILMQILTEATEERLGFDDYDEIDYSIELQTQDYNHETETTQLIITIVFNLIR